MITGKMFIIVKIVHYFTEFFMLIRFMFLRPTI